MVDHTDLIAARTRVRRFLDYAVQYAGGMTLGDAPEKNVTYADILLVLEAAEALSTQERGEGKGLLSPTTQAIHVWIRDDAPLSLKMVITPALVSALASRLEALSTPPVLQEGEPVGWRYRLASDRRCPWIYVATAPLLEAKGCEVQPLYAAPVQPGPDREALEAMRTVVARAIWEEMRGRRGIKNFFLHVEGKDTEGEFSDHQLWLEEVAGSVLSTISTSGVYTLGPITTEITEAGRSAITQQGDAS